MAFKKQGKSIRAVHLPKVKRWRRTDWDNMVRAELVKCEPANKVVFTTLAEAEQSRDRQLSDFDKRYLIYRCKFGPHFHLTSIV